MHAPKIDIELVFAVVACRAALLVLCAETAWRYFGWYRASRREASTDILCELMLGIAVVQCGFLIFTIYALAFGRVPREGLALFVYFVGDLLVTAGTVMHLRPALRIAQSRRPSLWLGIRGALACVAAGAMLALDLQ